MSDSAQADFGGGDTPPARPQFLRALVEAMGKWRHAPESGVNLVVISAASALPEAKRSEELVEQMSVGGHRGKAWRDMLPSFKLRLCDSGQAH